MIVGLVGVAVLLSGCGSDLNVTPTDDSTSSVVAHGGDSAMSSPSASPKAITTAQSMTKSQEQALGAAQDYLKFQAFSKKGLIQQLSSKYGDGFSLADATWAVNHLKVNWNQEAYLAGKNYLEFQHFSRSGLIQQLSSSAGDQFTKAQATYAVDKLGL